MTRAVKKAVVKADPTPGNMLTLIERLAFDPAANIEVVERLLAVQTEVMERQSKIDFEVSMSHMQPELPVIRKMGVVSDKRTGEIRYKYAKWEDVNQQIKPILNKYGFALTFTTSTVGEGANFRVQVIAILTHVSGYQRTSTMEVPSDGSGNKNAPQAIGSAIQYGKRYTAFALLNLQTDESEDDDGVAAGFRSITEEQVAELRRQLAEVKGNEEAFCKRFRIESLPEMPENRYELALQSIDIKRQALKGGAQ